MFTRQEVIDFCLTLVGSCETYPFRDQNWTIMQHKGNKKMFAAICEREGHIWVNVKCDPGLTYMWRESFEAVIPGYHMNKEHWNSIILNGTVPEDAIQNMIYDSYELTKPKIKKKSVCK